MSITSAPTITTKIASDPIPTIGEFLKDFWCALTEVEILLRDQDISAERTSTDFATIATVTKGLSK